jgi:hypothetical protein
VGDAPSEGIERLQAAYRATSFFVDGPHGRFAVRVGHPSPEADALAAAHGADGWTYITAYNPGSVAAPPERNEARQRELEELLADMGHPLYRGEGAADDRSWPPEPSLFAPGMSEAAAAALGRRFGQAAVVFAGRGEPARLLWTGDQT